MYAKLFSRITESSLMEESILTRYTFVMLLAIADPEGYVIGTDVAISRRLNMPESAFKKAIKPLCDPDPNSNSPQESGRRLIPSDGERGYQIVNYLHYRALRDEDDRRAYQREYQARYRSEGRDKSRPVKSGKPRLTSVNQDKPRLAQAEAEAEAESHTLTRAREEWPKLETILETAALRGIPRDCAEKWWSEHDARGGCDKSGQPVRRWESSLQAYAVAWRANDHQHKKPDEKNSKAYWEAKSRYDMVCSEIKAIEDRAPTDAMQRMIFAEPDKSNRTRLLMQRRQLRKELGLTS